MKLHENTLKAYYEGKQYELFNKRENEILNTLRGKHLTDRQIKDSLGYSDLNMVRPRITELCNKGIIEQCGDCKDDVTGKTVRIVRIIPKDRLQPQLDMFA